MLKLSRKRISGDGVSRTWKTTGNIQYGYNEGDYNEKIKILFEKKLTPETLSTYPEGADIEVEISDISRMGVICIFNEKEGLKKCVMDKDMLII
jgi:hypothetical protein